MLYEKHTFPEKGCHVCEFCEKDVRFPRVEFVDVLKIGGGGGQRRLKGGFIQLIFGWGRIRH